jgi:very-short-patch-repair endonuclease
MSGNKKPQTFRDCAQCGERFGPLGYLSQKFCSNACKARSQRGAASAKRGKAYPHLRVARVGACATCGAEYRATGDYGTRMQRYCSRDCYMRSRAETTIERKMREAFARAGISAEPQRRIGPFTVDFLLPGNIVVEADGDYWHAKPEVAAKDARKDAWLGARGYSVTHLTEREILAGADVIVTRWENATGQKAERP